MSAADTSTRKEIATLYSDHHSWLFAWLRKKLRCSHSAADVAQDTFLRIISSRDALMGVKQPRAYLTTTAKRLIVDQVRKRHVEQIYLAELAQHAGEWSEYPSPEQITIAVQALEEIEAALRNLSLKAREAFTLHYLDDQTHSQIATHLGVSTKMVQKYLAQALVQCQKIESGI